MKLSVTEMGEGVGKSPNFDEQHDEMDEPKYAENRRSQIQYDENEFYRITSGCVADVMTLKHRQSPPVNGNVLNKF